MKLHDEPIAPAVEALDSALAEAVAPVLANIEQLNELIAGREADLAVLRAALKRAERVLAALDPEAAAARRAPAHHARIAGSREQKAKERLEKRQRVEEYVRARPGEDFIASELNGDLEGISAAMIGDLLRELAEAGVLRLDRKGRGGSRIYRLVA